MYQVWSNGRDIAVARNVADVPRVLDRHYGVKGHTARECWTAVPDGAILDVISMHSTTPARVPAWLLANVPEWAGRLA